LSICFCNYCTALFTRHGINSSQIKRNIRVKVLQALNDTDPWLECNLSELFLKDEFGDEFTQLLDVRVSGITELIASITNLLKSANVSSRFLDGSPISNRISDRPFEDLWQSGFDILKLSQSFDYVEPLLYRFTTEENIKVFSSYKSILGDHKLIGAIRPAFPDLEKPTFLLERLKRLFEISCGEFDFYLYEIIRDYEWSILSDFLKSSSSN
jgi:hypothetical protein